MPAAYEENGKWFKQCSTTKQIFGPVDTKEELGQWFNKGGGKDGFDSYCKEEKKRYHQENPEKQKESNRRYYQKNPEKIKEYIKEYNRSPAGILSRLKSSAKQRGKTFKLTKKWVEEQSKLPEFNVCCYTGVEFDEGGKDENGKTKPLVRSFDRYSSTHGYTKENFAGWCCHIVNSIKNEYTLYQMTFVLMLIIDFLCKQINVDTRLFLNKMLDLALNSTTEYRKGILNREINPTIHLECEKDIQQAAK